MSAETIEKVIEKKPAEPIFSKRRKKLVTDPLIDDNPITVQVLGICSALAVTTQMKPTLVMAISVIFVVALSNFVISIMRNTIPARVRIIVQLAVVATLVTIVSEILKAFAYDMYKELSVFIGLIITNCIVMGRAEAFAVKNPVRYSTIDAFASGMGYTFVLIVMSLIRELLSNGSILNIQLLGTDWINWTIFAIAPGGFFVISLFIWGLRVWLKYYEE